ncbi:disintegrin and metalloproteinase domain-containing protein 9-like isoform X2 [Rhinatrema bivittatum]|nr:disintegrin and metalloproteinase domain-containing protein 9-like isoform X2 [Rhinatrema bivittatum]
MDQVHIDLMAENDTKGDIQQMEIKSSSFFEFTQARETILQKRRYVELYVVVTKELYLSMGSKTSSVINNLMQMVSYINTWYHPFNIVFLLIEVEIWTNENKIPMTMTDPVKQLDTFGDWVSKTIALTRNYDTVLLIHSGIDANPGAVNFGSVCSRYHGGLIMIPQNMKTERFSLLVTHMLGHMLGILHDNDRACDCPFTVCIMNIGIMESHGAQAFSSCSTQDIKMFLNKNQMNCLLNSPALGRQYRKSQCGNKIVEEGEECDCGTQIECQKNPCCEFGTCRLKGDAKCDIGECCIKCKVVTTPKVCRAAVSECDLPDSCDMKNPNCSLNIYKQNGSPCSNNKGYCYNGLCETHDSQCKAIFGSGSKSADPSCYTEANSLGDRFGNCGGVSDSYANCDFRHTLCGKIQCVHTSSSPTFSVKGAILYYRPKNTLCKSVDFLLSKNVVDQAWVKNGTKCAEQKMCINYQCVHLRTFQFSCIPEVDCNGRGVCNSIGTCHCDAGWSPPNCHHQEIGRTSFESDLSEEPTQLSSIKDTVVIIFSILFPIILLIAILIANQREIRRCCTKNENHMADGVEEDKNSSVIYNREGR